MVLTAKDPSLATFFIILKQSSNKEPYQLQTLIPLDKYVIRAIKGPSSSNLFYCWTYLSLQQQRVSIMENPSLVGLFIILKRFNKIEPHQQKTLLSLEICTIISSKRWSNQQQHFLPLDVFIFLATKGLSSRLPFFGYTIHHYPAIQHERVLSKANPHAARQIHYYLAIQKERA